MILHTLDFIAWLVIIVVVNLFIEKTNKGEVIGAMIFSIGFTIIWLCVFVALDINVIDIGPWCKEHLTW